MSASDEILNRLVAVTQATGPTFWAAWEPSENGGYRLKATGEVFSRPWANMVLQEVHPGSDLSVWQ
jgi:hypothetical protein